MYFVSFWYCGVCYSQVKISLSYVLFTMWKLELFETGNERGKHGWEFVCWQTCVRDAMC